MIFLQIITSVILAGAANAAVIQTRDTPSQVEACIEPETTMASAPVNTASANKPVAGLVSTCNAFHTVKPSEYCYLIQTTYGNFTLEQLYQWNPAVNSGCTNLRPGQKLCIGTTDGTTSTPHPGTTPNKPTQPNTANCLESYNVKPGDYCEKITTQYHISYDDFLKWNPQVNRDCLNLMAGRPVCVSASGSSSKPSNESSNEPSNKPSNKPTENSTNRQPMPGVTRNCKQWHRVSGNDSCAALISHYGVTFPQLLSWNTQIGSDCQTLWKDYDVCVKA